MWSQKRRSARLLNSRFAWGRAAALLALVYLMFEPPARASELPPGAAGALERISVSRPCAAAALLYVMLREGSESRGILYLPGLMTAADFARLVAMEKLHVEDFAIPPNLYADVTYYTEIRWSVEQTAKGAIIVSAQAQLVQPTGVSFDPPHLLEPLTRVLKIGPTLRVLSDVGA
jgi:hypothetical protein